MSSSINQITDTIWEYADDPSIISQNILKLDVCIFCKTALSRALQNDWEPKPNLLECDNTTVQLCRNCGWWTGHRYEKKATDLPFSTDWTWGSYGILKNLNLQDISTPIGVLRDYLAASYKMRNNVHPLLMEETVASIFKDIGYKVQLTAYSGDDGIDVILSNGTEQIGVQVKRYKNTIKAEQIRSFVGALIINGLTKGVFVTTSKFTRGAKKTAEISLIRGYPIKLINAYQLYDVLEIAQTKVNRTPEEWLKIVRPRLKLLESRNYMETYYLK